VEAVGEFLAEGGGFVFRECGAGFVVEVALGHCLGLEEDDLEDRGLE
jgi:hypothetical protein